MPPLYNSKLLRRLRVPTRAVFLFVADAGAILVKQKIMNFVPKTFECSRFRFFWPRRRFLLKKKRKKKEKLPDEEEIQKRSFVHFCDKEIVDTRSFRISSFVHCFFLFHRIKINTSTYRAIGKTHSHFLRINKKTPS